VVVVVVVVVVPEEPELLDESSLLFLAHEMMVRQKNKISNMCKIFFIFILIQKSDF